MRRLKIVSEVDGNGLTVTRSLHAGFAMFAAVTVQLLSKRTAASEVVMMHPCDLEAEQHMVAAIQHP